MVRIAALVGDLFFASRIEVVLGALGQPVTLLAADAAAAARLRATPPELLILDLGVDPAVRADVLDWAPAQLPVLAFGSHVDTVAQQAARQAGCATVTTNGRLDRDLPRFVRAHGGGAPGSP